MHAGAVANTLRMIGRPHPATGGRHECLASQPKGGSKR